MAFKKKKKGINPLAVGLAGVVAGAAGYAALKDKKTRNNLMDLAEEVKDQAMSYVHSPETKSKVKKVVKEAKKTTD